ncbi:ABC transporter permease [Lichenihabitans sp. Uapishka_5]|uniref:cell division protein FtsX n=1 Tax=Lichenihabitans sp. Uapishka_5 TaxID=3037302 RepID=UPI0029E7E565|nr:ABC transporter permease [Lichenihabitans sp. Uapishka_5]MDX7953329.1 ABC transporter permease [Lichenihabitans sp. Uapishka_5]
MTEPSRGPDMVAPAVLAGAKNGAPVPPPLPEAEFALSRNASLVPAASIASRALVTVVAIMTFLSALAAGSGLLIAGASRDWQRSVGSEMTIQLRPLAGHDIEAAVAKAASVARGTPGITAVEVYAKAASEKLLEPWLGTGLNLDELPVPRLIAVVIDHDHPPDLAALRANLADLPGTSVDDHHLWFAWLATMANTVVALAALIFGLVLVAMFLTVAFATRGAMAGNHEIIDILHFVGAEDRFIARQFQKHFLRLGLKGGALGGLGAIAAFGLAGLLRLRLQSTAGGDELEALFGSFALGWPGYAAIAAISVSIAVATGAMSRWIVFRQLQRMT